MNKARSLSFIVAVWTAMWIAASMAVYALFQFFVNPELTFGELAARHLWHTLVFGAVICGVCLMVFRHVLVQPISRIQRHLYGVGTGRLEKLEMRSNVFEARAIVDGVNLTVLRMEKGLPVALSPATEEAPVPPISEPGEPA